MSDDSKKTPTEAPADETGEQQDAPRSHRAAAEAAEAAFFTDADAEQKPGDEEEVDPELLKLSRRRKRRHPVISIAVVVLSVYMIYFVRQDLLYYLRSSEPVDLGTAKQAAASEKLKPNHYVTVRGAPDRKHSLILQGRFTGYDSFFRLQQTENRIFVQKRRKRRTVDREVPYVHSGRVLRFDSLPYLQLVRDYYTRRMSSAHDLTFEAVAKAKANKQLDLVDRLGQKVGLRPDQTTWINVRYPDEWVVQFSRRHHADVASARARLEPLAKQLGLALAVDDERSRSFIRFVLVAKSDAIRRVMAHFRDPKLHVGVVPRQISYTAKWDQLSVAGGKLVIDAADETFPARFMVRAGADDKQIKLEPIKARRVEIEPGALSYITVGAPFRMPTDAVVIVSGERPGDYWYYLLLFIVLTGFIIFNVLALVSRLRGATATAEASR